MYLEKKWVENVFGCFGSVVYYNLFYRNIYMRFSVVFCKYEFISKHISGLSIRTKGCYGVVGIEETKLVCAISRKLIFD